MDKKGFSIIEVLVVGVIVGILTAFVYVYMNNNGNETPIQSPPTPTISTPPNQVSPTSPQPTTLDEDTIIFQQTVPSNNNAGTDPTVDPKSILNLKVTEATDGTTVSIYLSDTDLTPSSIKQIISKPDESKTTLGGFGDWVEQNGEFLVMEYSSIDYIDLIIFTTDGHLVTDSVITKNKNILDSNGYPYGVIQFNSFTARGEMKVDLGNLPGGFATGIVNLNDGTLITASIIEE